MLALAVTGCASGPLAKVPGLAEAGPEAALNYYQGLSRLTPAELGRERNVVAGAPQTPFNQLRLAILLGQPRFSPDLGKGLGLLEALLKSTEPGAAPLHPLARIVADNYQERIRLDSQFEKQGQQLKDSQRKSAELQEKLDNLADIEKTLSPRSSAAKPAGGRR